MQVAAASNAFEVDWHKRTRGAHPLHEPTRQRVGHPIVYLVSLSSIFCAVVFFYTAIRIGRNDAPPAA